MFRAKTPFPSRTHPLRKAGCSRLRWLYQTSLLGFWRSRNRRRVGVVLLRCLRVRLEAPVEAKVFGLGACFLSRGLFSRGEFTRWGFGVLGRSLMFLISHRADSLRNPRHSHTKREGARRSQSEGVETSGGGKGWRWRRLFPVGSHTYINVACQANQAL